MKVIVLVAEDMLAMLSDEKHNSGGGVLSFPSFKKKAGVPKMWQK